MSTEYKYMHIGTIHFHSIHVHTHTNKIHNNDTITHVHIYKYNSPKIYTIYTNKY